MTSRIWTALALCGTLFAGAACNRPRDVVIVTLDTFRADRMGCYGSPSGLTPNLDEVAARGVLFEDATAVTPLTLPSHASIFTGRYPTATGVRNNGTFVLPEGETTLAEVFRKAGYETAAFVAAYPVQRRFGLAQGFDLYDDTLPRAEATAPGALPIFYSERDARSVTDRALSFWSGPRKGPRLLWVHYFDAHAPYAAPDPFASRPGIAAYDAEIAFVDAEAGRLVERIRTDSPRAIITVVADHGESLGEHGEKTHGVFLYQGTIRVPFLIEAPGALPKGVRVETPVSLVDLLPTVLRLAGVDPPAGVEGADLGPLIRGKGAPSRPVYAESYLPRLQFRFSELTLLRRGALKLVDAPSPELFDLRQDPGESRNLHGGHPDGASLAEELAAFVRSGDTGASDRASGGLDAEAEARLRSLGYASAGTIARGSEGRGRDPKTMVDYLRRYDRAVGLIATGKSAEGIAELGMLIPEAPENYMARYQLAAGLLAAGRDAEAEAELTRVVADAPTFSNGYLMLGEVQARQGKLDAASRSYDAAATTGPGNSEPVLAKAKLLESAGRFEPAAAAYREAIEIDPNDLDAASGLLALLSGRGETARGTAEIRSAAERHPNSSSLRIALGRMLLGAGDSEGAREAAQAALRLAPDRVEGWTLRGNVLLQMRQVPLAEEAFRKAIALSPDSPDATFGLARTLLAAGRTLEGEAALAETLRIDPNYEPALRLRRTPR